MTITLPILNEGEHYAGLILDETGKPTHHLILLPGDNDYSTWEKQVTWAESIGGVLPTRQEQSLLFANCKAQFQHEWYWSGEKFVSDSDYAWGQYFDYGLQGYSSTDGKGRARAVRRLVI